MRIFIDESGTFQPGIPGHRVSAIGALIIPDSRYKSIERKYRKLRLALPKQDGEVKGRLLNEQQIEHVSRLLFQHDALFEATIVDSTVNDPELTALHKEAQAQKITASLTEEHSPLFRRTVEGLRAELERTPVQLYVQSCVMLNVIQNAINHSTIYYSQRFPKELGRFQWVIDGKDRMGPTAWEKWWQATILPFLEFSSRDNPLKMIPWGNYSYFKRFETLPGKFKAEKLGISEHEPVLNIGKIMTESFSFSSKSLPGLELVDITVNSLRRALTGNLQRRGWLSIRALMIHRSTHYFEALAFGDKTLDFKNLPYRSVVKDFKQGGRNMVHKWPKPSSGVSS